MTPFGYLGLAFVCGFAALAAFFSLLMAPMSPAGWLAVIATGSLAAVVGFVLFVVGVIGLGVAAGRQD